MPIDGCIEHLDGSKCWYKNNKLHREDGPAIWQTNGDKYWYQHDLRHRVDGPAVEFITGYKAWWFRGKYIECSSQEEFERILNLKAFW